MSRMPLLFAFPGQGVQYEGMLRAMLERTPESRVVFDEVGAALEKDVLGLDTAEALEDSEAVQICLLTAGVASSRLLESRGIVPAMTAGLSIGAFGAAVAAGVLDLGDAARLVAKRGRLMQDAYPSGYGMMAVGGLTEYEVADAVEDMEGLYVANVNAERQIVLSGTWEVLERAAALLVARGATFAKKLRISVPSHCPLLQEASDQFAEAMADVVFRRPKVPYLSGSNARVLWDPARISDDLLRNMMRPTHWADAVRAAHERGIQFMVEMLPGKVLTGLSASVFEDASALEEHGPDRMAARLGHLARYD